MPRLDPNQQRLLAIVVMFIGIAGFSLYMGMNANTTIPVEPPEITAHVGDDQLVGAEGSYCWTFRTGTAQCVDKIGPQMLVADIRPNTLHPGDTVTFGVYDYAAPDTFTYVVQELNGSRIWNGTGTELRLDSTAGNYLLIVSASWDAGSISYVYPITVSEQ